jgi:hypothetical protein
MTRRRTDKVYFGYDMRDIADVSRRVKLRDGECVKCGSKLALTAAHLAPVKKLAEFGCDPCKTRYMITLCEDCHKLYDDAMSFIHYPYMKLTKRIKLAFKIIFRKRLLYRVKISKSKNRRIK